MLKKNKLSRLKAKIDRKREEAVQFQRIGKLREYAQSLTDIESLENSYIKLKNDYNEQG
jgi:cell fate (sporulation/competence/biofilm development) regulator YmcA (YheA/YmcA/DUF963 family)